MYQKLLIRQIHCFIGNYLDTSRSFSVRSIESIYQEGPVDEQKTSNLHAMCADYRNFQVMTLPVHVSLLARFAIGPKVYVMTSLPYRYAFTLFFYILNIY